MPRVSDGFSLPQTEADLQWYPQHRVQENDRLEFKRDMYGRGDEDKREMLRDVTALANHRGGLILIWVDEDAEGAASSVVGVEPSTNEPHDSWIRSSCLANIDERIVGLQVYEVPVLADRRVVVIRVPQSHAAAHMITFKGLNQFWKRHGRQKQAMSVDEIRDAFLSMRDMQSSIRDFLADREVVIRDAVYTSCAILYAALPAYFRNETLFEVSNPALRSYLAFPPLTNGRPVLTIDGLQWIEPSAPMQGGVPTYLRSLEVSRNGYVEHVYLPNKRRDESLYFRAGTDVEQLHAFLKLVSGLYEQFASPVPLLFRVKVLNTADIVLADRHIYDRSGQYPRLTKTSRAGHLDVGDFVVEDISTGAGMLLKRICDRIWNAFGESASTAVDDEGNFIPR